MEQQKAMLPDVRFKSYLPDFISMAETSIMKVDGIYGISSFKFG